MTTMLESGLPGAASSAVPHLSQATVLVPMLNLGPAEGMIGLAALLAAGGAAPLDAEPALEPRVAVLSVVEVPEDQPLSSGLDMARSYRALLDFLPSEVEANGRRVRVDHLVRVARSVPEAVREAVSDEQAGLVLFYWKGHAQHTRRNLYGRTLDSALQNPPCDTVLARPEGWRDARRVLLPVRGGPSAERALKLALSLAEGLRLSLTVMHNVSTPPGPGSDTGVGAPGQMAALGEEPFIIFNEQLQLAQESASVPVESILTLGGDSAAALSQEIQSDDLVVMGMAAPVEGDRRGQRPMALTVAKKKGLPLLVLRAAGEANMARYTRQARISRPKWEQPDIPSERWFVENTYHADEFRDPDEFLRLKRASGLSLSIALLTSNDEKHIYSILTGLKKVLQEMHPIADQIVMVDAGSTDGTFDVARSLGVEAYSAERLLPEQGSMYGRGESWWKSLSVMRGDICIWLDPRARRFHTSTAMSLAGPLLRSPGIQLVKAFESPHNGNGKDSWAESEDPPASGLNWGEARLRRREGVVGVLAGRIRVQALKPSDLAALSASQLAALPPHTLLQVLYQPLSGVIAPSSRETAGRREAMMGLPAFAGENNDVGLLLSVAAQYGTRAIAQVELRHARPAPPPQPSVQNALDVLQALERRLLDPQARGCAAELALRLQKELEGTGSSVPGGFEVRALSALERPPLREVMELE